MHLPTNARRWLAGAYLLVALFATWQRGVASREHTTFAIFRQSFVHLIEHRDLYARYPAEQGAEVRDRFKYSPTAAALFAPLSVVPYELALLIWNLLNVGLLFYAVTRVLPGREGDLALLCLLPEVLASVQSSSSNGLVAALMLLSLNWILTRRDVKAALAIGVGTAIKLFPLAVVTVAVVAIHRRQWLRFALVLAGTGVLLFVLPLCVVSVQELRQQYLSWRVLGLSDARDTEFGLSLIRTLRDAWFTAPPNWAFQLGGAVILFVPLLRRSRWEESSFGLRFGCSVLMFAVLFNHQAERPSYVIAAAGAVIWLVTRPRSLPLMATFALALSGGSVLPYAVLWLALQIDLLAGVPVRAAAAAGHSRWEARVAPHSATCRACGTSITSDRLECTDCRAIASA